MAPIDDFWLNTGYFQASGIKYTAVDKNNVPFGINSAVKLLGTVSAINAQDPHFGEVTITCNPVTVNPVQGNTVTSIQVPPASLTLGS